jgi:hypothetical protein
MLVHIRWRRARFRGASAAKHDAQLLQQGNELRVKFCKNVFIPDNLGQVTSPNLTRTTRLAVWIGPAPCQE